MKAPRIMQWLRPAAAGRRWLLLALLPGVTAAAEPASAGIEGRAAAWLAADERWLAGAPADAAVAYEALLAALPPAGEPVRGTLILRLARARQAAGELAGAKVAVGLLDGSGYVPEHHVLAARELAAVLDGQPHPGLRRTPIPPLAGDPERVVVGDGGVPDLAQALSRARQIRAATPARAIHILLAPGTHRLAAAVELTAADAGRPGAPLVIASRDPARPATLSGGSRLAGWKPVDDASALERLPAEARGHVRVAPIADLGPIVLGGGHSSRRAQLGDPKRACSFKSFPVPELFLGGAAQPMAAWPDGGKTMGMAVGKAPAKPDELARRLRWRGEADLWMHGYWHWDWSDAWERVAQVTDQGVVELAPPTNIYGLPGRSVRLVNALSEIDQPGEWKIDGAARRVYWWPPAGADPATAELSAAIGAIRAERVPFLQIRDLRFTHLRGDAIVLADCDDAVLAGLDIRAVSGMALRSERGKRLLVHSCTMENLGRNGMDILAGDWATLERGDTVVENCRMGGISRIDRTYTPGAVLDGYGFLVRHCHFEHIPSSGIRIESGATRVELCRFRSCVYESGDQGAIDMWANPLLRGNVIRWNDFHRILGRPHGRFGAAGVRLDDWMSGFMISENVFRTGSVRGFGGVQINRGSSNWIEGNLHLDGHALVSGKAGKVDLAHERAAWVLKHAAWQSPAWGAAHPMVSRVLEVGPNHLIDNLSAGGRFGNPEGAWCFANRPIEPGAPAGDGLEGVAVKLPPWRTIPVDRIGAYVP
jgi:hypothetical protein